CAGVVGHIQPRFCLDHFFIPNLYFLSASLAANKQKSVLDPSFTLRTTRSTSVWADTYAFCKAKPSIMSEKTALRNNLSKLFAINKQSWTRESPI
ncbi:hypothetical protein, partial [Limnohabitans sp.]|uniref:hypothetical protein n=1 Tax=Limnohabitans sp. TaxID=1907725 RepID=UPI00289F0C54